MNKIINTILFFLAFCCFYAIGNITLGWFWAIGYAENSQEINTIILNLSYSYIAGIIVYILTVMLPVIWENYRLQPILKEQVKSIGIMLANMLVGFPYEEDYLKIDISDIEKCREILSNADWNNENKLWIYPKGKNKLFQTFKSDFDEIQNEITILIQTYKSHLTTKQILYLESIKNARFQSLLSILEKANVVIPENGMDGTIKEFLEVLKTYERLKRTFS